MEQEQKLDKEFLEIIQKASVEETLSDEELKKIKEEAKQSIEFLKLIDKINFPSDKYVVYNDGDEQLIYENGEFFIQSATDSSKPKVKKKRLEAKDMYIEYFIKYIINPIIERKKLIQMKNELSPKNELKKDISKNEQKDKDIAKKQEKIKVRLPEKEVKQKEVEKRKETKVR